MTTSSAFILGLRRIGLVQQVIVGPGGVEAKAVGLEPRLSRLGVGAADLDSEAEPSRGHWRLPCSSVLALYRVNAHPTYLQVARGLRAPPIWSKVGIT